MSTILDSLKKSSDQREGKNSSIDSFSFSKNRRSSHSGYIVAFFIIALTAAILYFGYNYLYSDDEQETVMDTITAQATNQKATEKQIEEKKIGTGNENTEVANTNLQKLDKPSSDSVKERIKQIKAKREEEAKSLVSVNNNQESKENTEKLSKEVSKLEQKDDGKVDPIPDIADTNQIQKLAPVNQPLEEIPSQNYLYVYQLPFSVRKDIPKLKLNIHVFDEVPENRIVVINGVKFAVGDLIDNAVLVKDILQSGVLLEFNEREFLVPK